ncbi:MAG: sigma-70 family RNA polymerase sigma factor [Ruminococcaceae bacterium]|nr:sigma-70 family RNA polymerase sigma factor [Oscillospiraceae bacterium]
MKNKNLLYDNSELIQLYKSGDQNAKELLITENLNLVRSIALRFKNRGQDYEDLIEIGKIGLLKAIEGYDDTLGYTFSTYAFPLITGEIKRFLRDDGPIKISRSIKSNASIIMQAKQQYIKQHGKEPHLSQLCEICNLSAEDITLALEACSPTVSIHEKIGGKDSDITIGDTLFSDDFIEELTEKIALHEAVDSLCEFDRKILHLRYYKNLTQTQTASLLGTNQVKVSRCEKKILEKLRSIMAG